MAFFISPFTSMNTNDNITKSKDDDLNDDLNDDLVLMITEYDGPEEPPELLPWVTDPNWKIPDEWKDS